MTIQALLNDLIRRGVKLWVDGENLRYRSPIGVLTLEDKERLGARKAEILQALRDGALAWDVDSPSSQTEASTMKKLNMGCQTQPLRNCTHDLFVAGDISSIKECRGRNGDSLPVSSVTISGNTFAYCRSWHGQSLPGEVLSLDTETALIRGQEVPPLALASASSGTVHCLIHPDRVGEFLLAHHDRQVVFHNVSFDFWVIASHLASRGEKEALDCWWELADAGRMHDTMLLDMLVRLARSDAYPAPRNLALVSGEYAGLEVRKDDPFRLRYGEIVGKDWTTVEEGFFAYAISDAIATRLAYDGLCKEASSVAARAGVQRGVIEKYGLLSEGLQVKASIALSTITRNGLHLDLGRSALVQKGYVERLRELTNRLQSTPDCVGLFQLDREDHLKLTRNDAPSFSQKVLRQVLTRVATEIGEESGQAVRLPRTPKGALSLSTAAWSDHAEAHGFLKDWTELMETAKLVQFFGHLQEEVVHPRYTILVRTGRTSCSQPNIQQIPRKGGLREIFIPSPGHLLLSVDYNFIELRTLAAVCEAIYGHSKLADVIRQGVDPHAYTAAMLLGMDLGEFMALEKAEPGRYKQWRQLAKPVNFGIPGGLGVDSLVKYAYSTYGVEFSNEEAREFRDRLIQKIYPELALYLAEDGMTILSRNLGADPQACWRRFDWKGDRSPAVAGGVRNVIRGKTQRADGKPYSPGYLTNVWNGLEALNRKEELALLLANRVGSEDLCSRLFHSGVATLTGRVRGRVGYCQARNTPFQGLAADGAKLALWNLIRAGVRVVGFVHDEVLVELKDLGGFVALAEARKVEEIMCRSMAEVTGTIPVACEFSLAARWSKDAKPIIKGDRLYPWGEECVCEC